MLPKYPIKAQNATNTESTDVAVFIVPDGAISGNEVNISAGGGVAIGDTITDATEGSVLFAGAAGVLAQDNTNFKFTDSTNTLTILKIAGLNNGYGAANAGLTFATGSQISSNGDGRFWFGSSGIDSMFLLGVPDSAFVMASSVNIGWTAGGSAAAGTDIGLSRKAAGVLKVTDGLTGAGCVELLEQTAPSAATANSVRIFAQDNGAGKTQLMALFATGAAQQIAIEP